MSRAGLFGTTGKGAAVGAGAVVLLPLFGILILFVITTLGMADLGPLAEPDDVHKMLHSYLTWPWEWLLPISVAAGTAAAHALVALDNFLDRCQDTARCPSTTCAACDGEMTLEGKPSIWVCVDPSCIMRERAWWER